MSCATSPSAGRLYGVARVLRAWEMARSSFYPQRGLVGQCFPALQRRGPKTGWTDGALTEKIGEVLAESPFYGEGHRKVWARLRFAGVQGVREYCGGFRAGAAAGIRLRHNHGSQYLSNDYRAEITFLGMESSPAFGAPRCR